MPSQTTFGLKLASFYAEFARARARLDAGAGGNRHLRHFGCGGHLRQYRPKGRRLRREKTGIVAEAGFDPSHPARPPCDVFFPLLGGDRQFHRTTRHPKSGISSAAKCARPRNFSRPGRKARAPCRISAIPCSRKISTGLARLVRGFAVEPALENVALWHERDISHSAVERIVAPDATIRLDFALARLANHHHQAGGLSEADEGQFGCTPAASCFRNKCCSP